MERKPGSRLQGETVSDYERRIGNIEETLAAGKSYLGDAARKALLLTKQIYLKRIKESGKKARQPKAMQKRLRRFA